jgi:hypothetical protein
MSNQPIFVSTIRPGLLVHVSTSIKGNVRYEKTEGQTVIREDGSEFAEWETERTIKDPVEQKRAVEVRSKARSLVVGVCAATEHGLLCPDENQEKLEEAYTKARRLVDEFNATSTTTILKFNALAGRVEPNDRKAVRAINGEVRDLIAEMTMGLENLDPERVRAAASRAKKIGTMLAPEMQTRIEEAVKSVRKVAKDIAEAGEQAAIEVDAAVINKLAAARTAFLDIEDAAEVAAPQETSGRALDLAPTEEHVKAPRRKAAAKLDLD